MMIDMISSHSHLAATDTGTNITHTIIVTDTFMLIIRICLAGLCSIEHDFLLTLSIRTDQCTATRGGDHLITVE